MTDFGNLLLMQVDAPLTILGRATLDGHGRVVVSAGAGPFELSSETLGGLVAAAANTAHTLAVVAAIVGACGAAAGIWAAYLAFSGNGMRADEDDSTMRTSSRSSSSGDVRSPGGTRTSASSGRGQRDRE